MLALCLAVLASAWPTEAADDNANYNVHGAVAFIRTGERTPRLSPYPPVLTALGAQQMHELGRNFRTRYIDEQDGPRGLGVQNIPGMSVNMLKNEQILIQTLDKPYLHSSAQAFMQGLYPPFTISSPSTGTLGDATGIMANGSVVDFPLGGYQYPNVQALSFQDPQSIYVAGAQNCPTSQQESVMYFTTDEYQETKREYDSFYANLDIAWFDGVIEQDKLDYLYAFEIYDYLSYAYSHNSDVYEALTNDSRYDNAYRQLRALADEEAWQLWGNTTSSTADADNRAMAGKTLAARILGQFQDIVTNSGNSTNGLSNPLTLIFGEHEPFVSLFSILIADHLNKNFRSVPPFASTIVFELFSTGSDDAFPSSESDLWVRFNFQNGTNFSGDLPAHPMFANSPSRTDMSWSEFEDMFSRIMVSTLPEWCSACNSGAVFCWGVNNGTMTYIIDADDGSEGSDGGNGKLSPTVAGIVGAVVTLAVAGLLFAAAMLLGGIRFHRTNHARKDLGGFKGSAKLASDADISLPKGGAAPAGIVSFGADDGGKKSGHERVGSWELRQKEFGATGDLGDEFGRGSFDAIEAAMGRPVQPSERV